MILEEQGYEVQTAASMAEAARLLEGRTFDLVYTDLRLPDTDGLEVLNHIKAENPHTEVILMTAHGSLDIVISAIKRGAYYYVESLSRPTRSSCSPSAPCNWPASNRRIASSKARWGARRKPTG